MKKILIFLTLFSFIAPSFGEDNIPKIKINGIDYRLVFNDTYDNSYYLTEFGYCHLVTGKRCAVGTNHALAARTDSSGPFIILKPNGSVVETFEDNQENRNRFMIITYIKCYPRE